jgi:hypothetical protein
MKISHSIIIAFVVGVLANIAALLIVQYFQQKELQ